MAVFDRGSEEGEGASRILGFDGFPVSKAGGPRELAPGASRELYSVGFLMTRIVNILASALNCRAWQSGNTRSIVERCSPNNPIIELGECQCVKIRSEKIPSVALEEV